MKKGYKDNIESLTIANTDFRHVLYSGQHMQLVLMTLQAGEDIGFEVHEDNDQFFRFEEGEGDVVINDTKYAVADGDVVIVPSGAKHNISNTGSGPLKLYTIYSPAHHKDGIVRSTKEDAINNEAEFDGVTSE
jgi:mannose-6-phosphate isomerase-like protein (cupin superfamily)